MIIYKKIALAAIFIILITTLSIFVFLIIRSKSNKETNNKSQQSLITREENNNTPLENNNIGQLETPESPATNSIEETQNKPELLSQKNKTSQAANVPSTSVSQEMIKCKLKFHDTSSKLNLDEVMVEWNCTGYTGWECTLKDVEDKGSTKIKAQLPSGSAKMFCWWPGSHESYKITWYDLKCTRQDGKIKTFQETYLNFR
jgi:hypothetical protein